MAALRLENRSDFITLLLLSTYSGLYSVLKKGGEWTAYLGRDCCFFNIENGICSIHGESHQSLICKSYDSHNCWYIDAFHPNRHISMIPFSTDMLIWMEQKYNLMMHYFAVSIDWEKLCLETFEFKKNTASIETQFKSSTPQRILPFRESRSDQYLFLPPYSLLKEMNHFELLSFRLGFPGLYVAAADSHWTYLVRTSQNELLLKRIRDKYFPSIGHKDVVFSFEGLSKRLHLFSGLGNSG